MQLIEVAFKGNRKEFFHWPQDEAPPLRVPIIVEADRGEDLGFVHATGELAAKRFDGASHGRHAGPVSRSARRLATAEERERERALRAVEDEEARRRSALAVREHGLVMKLTDAEWQWDRRKLTLYFTAEKRVDFRALVRDLASAFRTRIELKQIGVRDEAKRLDGIGRCGRQYCSASWLPELRPVNLAVAKDQNLSLNPLQISGSCGRLMCCLRYEHEFYVQSRKRFPKEGRVLVTSRGEEKVLANDIFRDCVTLRGLDGEVRVIPLADLRQETAASGGTPLRDAPAAPDDALPAPPPRGPRPPRGRRALPVRDPLMMRDDPSVRAASTRAERSEPAREGATRQDEERHDEEQHDEAHQDVVQRTDVQQDEAQQDEAQQAAIIPLGTPEAKEADAQRLRADRGELPAAGDITPTGDDRRRRRRGRRGGRRARGRNGGNGGSDGDRDGSSPPDASADDGE